MNKFTTRMVLGILTGAVCLSLCSFLVFAKAIPKQPGKVYGPSQAPQAAPKPTEYQKLLNKYITNIGAIEQKRVADRIADFKQGYARRRQVDSDITGKESQMLEQLRTLARRRPDNKLAFEGDCPERKAFSPTSAVSARIFATLVREDAVDPSLLMSLLHRNIEALSEDWVALAKDLTARAEPGSRMERWGALVLYKKGVSREIYRRVLERLAVDKGDNVALDALLFTTDEETGEPQAVRTPENIELVTALSNPDSPPEIQVTCAEFLCGTGGQLLAETICRDLLSQRYKGMEISKNPPKEDYPLARARLIAMHLMFYRLRNERAFRQIYDISRLPQTEMEKARKGLMPKDWVRSDFYALMKHDIETARSLIEELKSYHQKVCKLLS